MKPIFQRIKRSFQQQPVPAVIAEAGLIVIVLAICLFSWVGEQIINFIFSLREK
jgi:hypothetical protein